MAHFKIEGLRPYDGEYPIELDNLTNRELHLIKEISGVRAAELGESFAKGDNDLIVAFTIIALQRAGQVVDRDRIWDASVGAIVFVVDEVEEDARPPDSPTTSGGPSEDESGGTENVKPLLSGLPLSNGGDLPQNDPSPTGIPA